MVHAILANIIKISFASFSLF